MILLHFSLTWLKLNWDLGDNIKAYKSIGEEHDEIFNELIHLRQIHEERKLRIGPIQREPVIAVHECFISNENYSISIHERTLLLPDNVRLNTVIEK